MVGGDRLSITGARGGPRCVAALQRSCELQPADFAHPWLQKSGVDGQVVGVAASTSIRRCRCFPPPPLVTGSAGRPAGTFRRLLCPRRTRCGLAGRRLVGVSDTVSGTIGCLHTHPTLHCSVFWCGLTHLMALAAPATRCSLLRPPLPSPSPSTPPVACQRPVASRAVAGVGYRPLGGFQLCRRAPRQGWRCL